MNKYLVPSINDTNDPGLDPAQVKDYTGRYLYHPDYGFIYVTSMHEEDGQQVLYGMTFNSGPGVSRFSLYFELNGCGKWIINSGFTQELKFISKITFLNAWKSLQSVLTEDLGEKLLEIVKKDNAI